MTKFGWFGIVAAFVLAGCSGADATDGNEQVGESEDHLLAGRRVSTTELASLLRQAGFPSSVIGKMVCTAKYESNFYERASNRNSNGSVDYGVFQINSVHFGDRGCPSSATGLYQAAANARCAKTVYDSQGLNAWVAYKKHRSECDRYAAPPSSGAAPAPTQQDAPLPTDTTGADDPPANDPGSGAAPDDGGGGCWSGTLEEMVDANTCVESKFNGVWYQCHEGQWYRGVSGSSGPYGDCASVHAL